MIGKLNIVALGENKYVLSVYHHIVLPHVDIFARIVCNIEKIDKFCTYDCPSQESSVAVNQDAFAIRSSNDNNAAIHVVQLIDVDLSSNRSYVCIICQLQCSCILDSCITKLSMFRRSTVRGRVLSKSAIRNFDEDQERFFFFDLTDGSATVRVKAFNVQCDRNFSNVTAGKVC
jgi:hypothetical protein